MRKDEIDTFLSRPADTVGRALIGCTLLLTEDGIKRGGIIVETEAYNAADPASHSFRGKTVRNGAMYGPPGTLYVYFIYGVHYCLNIVAGNGDGQAVLLRAIEPTEGLAYMQARRPSAALEALCNGPAKLVEALGVSAAANGRHLLEAGFSLSFPDVVPEIIAGPRVGITKATDAAWNFRLAGSRFVSRKPQAPISGPSQR